MQNYAFNIIKAILDDQTSIKFTVDEKNNAFINNQFDAPIVLAVGNRYEPETTTEHVHRIIRDPDPESMSTFLTCINTVLDYVFHNLFNPIEFIHITDSRVRLQTLRWGYCTVELSDGLFTKTVLKQVACCIPHSKAYKRFTETSETFDLDFTALEQRANAAVPMLEEDGEINSLQPLRPHGDDEDDE